MTSKNFEFSVRPSGIKNALIDPRTKADYLALARETSREMANVLDLIKARDQELANHFGSIQNDEGWDY